MTDEKKETSPQPRRIEKQVEISATPEQVWRMLTDPIELAKWFPLEARVTPGEGGSIFLSWGPAWEATSPISIWEQGKRLQTISSATSEPIKMDWQISTRGGKTIVTFVQSGVSSGADWENEFWDSTNFGWEFMFTNLRHCLERHPGKPRLVAWPRLNSQLSRPGVYKRLAAPGAIFSEGTAGLHPGNRYELRTANGEKWTGRVEFVVPPRGFCVTVEPLNDALFWVTIEGSGENIDAQIWISLYGVPPAHVSEIERHWAGELKRILT